MATPSIIADRVRERMDALGVSGAEVDRTIEAAHSFTSDILRGRKKDPGARALVRMARALDCDPEYLVGEQDAPRRSPDGAATLTLSGTIERGAWRLPDGDPAAGRSVPIAADARYAPTSQRHYEVNDGVSDAFRVPRGAFVTTIPLREAHGGAGVLMDGDLIVARLGPDDAPQMTALYRVARRPSLVALDASGSLALSFDDGDVPVYAPAPTVPVAILGVVVRVLALRA